MSKFFQSILTSKHCFIIAEAGVNHNGSLKIALKLIDIAKKAGADAVKFQTYKTESLIIPKTLMTKYQIENLGKNENQFNMLKKLELNFQTFRILKKYCDKKNIIFLSTPHTNEAIDFLEPLVPAYKIASGDLTNLSFLEKVSSKNKPLILSTGMATIKEVKEAINTIKKHKNNNIILLHCTSSYPCPFDEVNLKAMLTLKKSFKLPVGYSDHTQGIIVPLMAVALGAKVLEKHFTLDNNMVGPDHKASLAPNAFNKMVKTIKKVEKILGTDIKKPVKSEKEIMKIARKSIIANVNIYKGSILTRQMLVIKRPGFGIPPKYLKNIIGRRIKKSIKKNQMITYNLLE